MKGLLVLFISSIVLPAHAGIVIYGTRIIYPAEKNEVLVQLMNQENVLHWYSRGLMMVTRHYRRRKSMYLFY